MGDPRDIHTDGDQIQVGDVQKSVLAIGAGAQAIFNQITQAMPTQAEEAEQQDARERRLLADGLQHIVNGLTRQAQDALADSGQGSPYKALLDYTISDAALFYGRDTAISELQSRLRDPLTVLHSESGAGKTSLLKAGLMPRLLAAGDVPIYLRFFRTPPLQALRQTLIGAGQQTPDLSARPLHDFLRVATGLLGSGRLVVLLDQFEEIFTQHGQPDRAAFATELAPCLDDPALPVRWVMALRGEWLSQIATFDPPVNRPYSNSMLLRALTADQARAVIEQPARLHGVSVEPALTNVLLADLTVNGEIAPPHLQLVCDALYRTSADDDFDMRLDEYHALGGAQGILQNHLHQVLEREVGPDYREAARRLLEALIDSQGRRAQRDQDQLVGELERLGIAPVKAGEALRLLLNNRLLRVIEEQDEDQPEQVYELAHDYLLERIALDPETQARKAAQELLERETLNYEEYGSLLSPDRLAIIEAQENWLYIDPEAADLIVASRAERDRLQAEQARQRQRQVRILTGAAVVALILAVTAIFFAVQSRSSAEVARQQAERAEAALQVATSRQLAAQASDLLDQQHQLAMLLGIEAATIAPGGTVEAWSILWDGLNMKIPNATPVIGYTSGVTSVAFSPDGQTLAVGADNNIIVLWDMATGQPRRAPLEGHAGWVSSVAFSPDGQTLASASYDGVLLWDVATGQLLGEPLISERTIGVNSVAFSPDGKTLASGGTDSAIILWDVTTGQPRGEPLGEPFRGGGEPDVVNSVAFSPDGKTLASGSNDSTIILWDVATGQPRGEPLSRHTLWVASVAFSPDGKTLASGSGDETIILWDVATGQPRGDPLRGHAQWINSVAFSPDGQTLASGSNDSTIRLWDVETGMLLDEPLSGHTSGVTGVAFSPDGQTLASASWDRTFILWGTTAQPPGDAHLTGHTDWVNSVAFSPDGQMLASGSRDETVILWDVETGQPRGEPPKGHTGGVNSVAFSPDGKTLASGSNDSTIILWDVATGQPRGEPLRGHTGSVTSVTFSPDGKTLASSSWDETIILWDVTTGQPQAALLTEDNDIAQSVAFSPDGQTLASGTTNSYTVILWDVVSGQIRGDSLVGHINSLTSVTFSPDGKSLASASIDGTIILWDVTTGQSQGSSLNEHESAVVSVAFSPDGQTLASASSDGIILWDVATHQALGAPPFGHGSAVDSLAFSPDGLTLASGNDDQTITLWAVGRESWLTLACQRAGRNMTYEEWARYLPDEPYRATCSEFDVP